LLEILLHEGPAVIAVILYNSKIMSCWDSLSNIGLIFLCKQLIL
jgi:hypothetical protein